MFATKSIAFILILAGGSALTLSIHSARVGTEPAASVRDAIDLYRVTINRPAGPPTIDTGLRDHHGDPVGVHCTTCHDSKKPAMTATAADLDEFHQGLAYAHGSLTCLSCHNSGDYSTLKGADGRVIEFSDVMNLCAQCHGPQSRDYRNGSHGGMTGYWDLSRGPRHRKNCIDCHDPHSPARPAIHPVFPPKDVPIKGNRHD